MMEREPALKARNAVRYSNDLIECEVEHPTFGWVPFSATSHDADERGKELYATLSQPGNHRQPTDTERSAFNAVIDAQASAAVRAQRDQLLAETDHLMVSDVQEGMADSLVTAWKTYRQALRDIPEQSTFPHSVQWPQKP